MAECEVIPLPDDSQPKVRCCTKCGEVKPITEYYFKDRHRIARKERCKKCHMAAVKANILAHPERSYKKKHYNKSKESALKGYLKHRDKRRASGLAYYYKNKERQCALKRQRYAENRELAIEKTKKWRAENPEKVKAWVHANRDRMRAAVKRYVTKNPKSHLINRYHRKMRKKSVGGRLTAGLPHRLLLWQKGACPYCKTIIDVVSSHMDHVIPLSRGGRHCDSNMQLTCKSCNLRKHAKDPILFGREMGIFIPSTELAI